MPAAAGSLSNTSPGWPARISTWHAASFTAMKICHGAASSAGQDTNKAAPATRAVAGLLPRNRDAAVKCAGVAAPPSWCSEPGGRGAWTGVVSPAAAPASAGVIDEAESVLELRKDADLFRWSAFLPAPDRPSIGATAYAIPAGNL